MPEGFVTLNDQVYKLASDELVPRGKRAISRRLRDSQLSDPGRIVTARWKVSGPIGQSRERQDGFLACDYVQNLDHRNNDLLTSATARNTLTLSGSDPLSSASAALGGFALGAAALGGGSSLSTAQDLSHMDEDRAYLFCHRGAFTTHVDIAAGTPSVVTTTTHASAIKGAAVWLNRGYVGLGPGTVMQRRLRVTGAASSYEDVSGEYAAEMVVGSDRLWMVDADEGNSDDGKVKYSLDALASISNSFNVGDRLVGTTGIGTLGPLTAVGSELGAYSFTDAGKPVRILEALRGHRSQNNGAHMASAFGWHYITTDIGLYAWDGGSVVNPVSPSADPDFEGPVDGVPIHVYAYKDSVWLNILTETGHSYTLRGMFGPETAATGKLDWYVFRYQASTESHCIFSTALRTNPTLLMGEGANTLAYYTLGRRLRDISDANYVWGTDGGTWWGSTLVRTAGMRCNLRHGKFITENCDANNTWQLAVSPDEGAYVNVGSAVTSNGLQTVRPVSGGAPLSTVAFSMLKPRLTQVAASSSSPPQVRSFLDLTYDERPDEIEEVTMVIELGGRRLAGTEWTDLTALGDSGQTTPVTARTPDDTSDRYAVVVDVGERIDLTADAEGVTVTVQFWEVS